MENLAVSRSIPIEGEDKRKYRDFREKANAAEAKHTECSSDSENIGLVVQHAMPSLSGKAAWIIDSGAMSHMCNDQSFFVKYNRLKTPLKVTLGDGYEVDAVGRGVIMLDSVLRSGERKKCNLQNVLYVPRLSYNLFSVSVTTERGKTVSFGKTTCQVLDEGKLVAVATKVGGLNCLNFHVRSFHSNTAETQVIESKEDKWHRRFGHLGEKSLQTLAKEKLVNGFDYDASGEISFCQACIEGKLHKSQFPAIGAREVKVHNDVCGKI